MPSSPAALPSFPRSLIKSSVDVAARAPQSQASTAAAEREVALCGGEPCAAVVRGGLAFLDRRLRGLDGNGRACADCHMPTDHFQLSPASVEARFRLLQLLRRFNPDADDPLFRPIDADDFRTNGENASDFSNLRQNGLIRILLPLPRKIRLIDPVTNRCRSRPRSTSGGWCRPSTTSSSREMTARTRGTALPQPDGWLSAGCAVWHDLQEQALAALRAHAEIQNMPPRAAARRSGVVSARAVHEQPRSRAVGRDQRRDRSPTGSGSAAQRARDSRARPSSNARAASAMAVPRQSTTPFPIVRYHDILTQCPRPVDQNPHVFAFKPCPTRLARNVRTYEIELSVPTTHPRRSGSADGMKIRRTSSDPGRAFQTGFVGGPPPFDDWNKFDVPGLRGIRNTAPYFHNNSADTLEEVVDHYIELFKFIKAVAPPRRCRRRPSPRPMASISIASRSRRNARRCSRICESCRGTSDVMRPDQLSPRRSHRRTPRRRRSRLTAWPVA